MTHVSGVGSWPGESAREAIVTVRDLLTDADGLGLPYLPELPARGPGADVIGRTAALLADLAVDLQPSGWRFTDRPGRDHARATSLWRQDLDELAEAYDGWSGPLKVQVTGPWTLGATIELPRGERAVADHGARRDLVGSLAEGLRAHLADVERLVPGAEIIVQVDEPGLPAVLEGRLPTASGYGTLRAVDRSEVRDGLREVLAAAGERTTLVHCCAGEVPVQLVRESGARGISLDTSLLDGARWEQVAEAVEAGMTLWAGAVPTTGGDWRTARERLVGAWQRIGLPVSALADVVVTPACGLAGAPPSSAVAAVRTTTDLASALTDLAAG